MASAIEATSFFNFSHFFYIMKFLFSHKSNYYRQLALVCIFVFFTSAFVSAQRQQITGVIYDATTNETLPGVTVNIKGSNLGTSSDKDGKFTATASVNDVLRFTFVGYKTYEIRITEGIQLPLKVVMTEDALQMDEFVVEAGIIQHNKAGFTGSFNTVKAEEIKAVGNVNVLQSLKSLDPAFVIVESNMFGSNPNMLAEIELRGPTTMDINTVKDEAAVSSNLPLFILDGFETSLQVVNDLDINRIESITVLKDAGSTAIYGAKGANGVIVIETVKPKPGEVFINYNGNYTLAAPILSVYNLMNASEKLEFELLSGRYGNVTTPSASDGQKRYFDRLAMVQSGIDSYWMSEPVRNTLAQAHSLMLSGGKEVQYIAGVNFRANPGVMKGSQRNTYGGNLRLVYRGKKGFSISNDLSVMSTQGKDGSWGSFKSFADANPYYAKRNADGTIPKYLDPFDNSAAGAGSNASINPLYNAMLGTRNDNNIFNVTNNTSADWRINPAIMIRGSLSLTRDINNTVNFIDPANSRYDSKPYDEKGSYTSRYSVSNRYNANMSANYSKSFGKNNFTLIGRTQIQQSLSTNESLVAVGFPIGTVGYPSQAFSYQKDSRPGYSESTRRSVGFVTAFNYNYNYRYLFDVNFNSEGASVFGRNRRFQSFWSVGLGWNLSREEFAKNWDWLDEMKIRATYGMNGNDNVNVVTQSVYTFSTGSNVYGQPSHLSEVGNPDLKWQIVTKKSIGVDIALLEHGKLRLTGDVYDHLTDPMVIKLDQKPSTGISSFPLNMGYMRTRGYEFRASYGIIYRQAERFFVTVRATGSNSRSRYGGFASALNSLNEEYKQLANSESSLLSLQRYVDGNGPHDMWAVRSLGIDPATGWELFLDRYDRQTYNYDAKDRVVIASSRPDIQGIIGFNVRYKNLNIDASLRYYIGGHQYNTALFNKVENITYSNIVYNQDKRALYDRWKKAGDISQFRSISLTNTPSTPTSSRFIQKENYFRGEAINIRWSFAGEPWLAKFKLRDLTIGVSTQDIFTLSSIKIERGIEYPFQRSVQMNLSMRF